MFCTIGSVSSK